MVTLDYLQLRFCGGYDSLCGLSIVLFGNKTIHNHLTIFCLSNSRSQKIMNGRLLWSRKHSGSSCLKNEIDIPFEMNLMVIKLGSVPNFKR